MQLVEQAIKRFEGVIDGGAIEWERYLKPEDKSRVIPAEALAERGKARLLLGAEAEQGLTLPWEKTHGKVLIKRGKVALWAGWSRHGKTQMLKHLMLHGIKSSERPLVASMEEEVLEVWTDMATMACANPEPSSRNIDAFVNFVRGKLWLYDQQGRADSRRIQAVIRYAAAELGVTQVVVDSLMMLAIDRDDYDAQSRFVGDLKSVAKDTGVTVHLVAHMRKRDGKGSEDSPGGLHDIAGGHEIGSMVDYVFIPWRNMKDTSAPCLLRVEKARGRYNWVGNVGLNFHTGSRQFVEDAHPMRFWEGESVAF